MLKNSFSNPSIIQDELVRKLKLEEIGLTEDIILDIARNAVTFKTDATEFDTMPGPGVAQWNAMVKGLRIQMSTRGWEKYNVKGIEGIKSCNKPLVILPISGNAATGNPKQPAGLKKRRGEAGINIINKCCQGNLFNGYIDNQFEEINEIYILLYYNNCKELRIELSKPSHIVSGMIKAWEERIIFPSQELISANPIILEDNLDNEYDIFVTARENTF